MSNGSATIAVVDVRAPDRLRTLPSWLAGQLSQAAHRLTGDALAVHGLRRHHYRVLATLAQDGQATQAEVGRRLWLDRSDLHGVLAELDAAGLTTRVRDERDRRRNLVALTAEGERVLSAADEDVQAAQEALLAPLSDDERRAFLATLARLVDHHTRARS
jgi:MarR family transcriptional regulator, lower aerobic nicotinate degradation pathway regulator